MTVKISESPWRQPLRIPFGSPPRRSCVNEGGTLSALFLPVVFDDLLHLSTPILFLALSAFVFPADWSSTFLLSL